MLRTVGYGNKTPAVFFKELEDLNPDLVIDVRASPRGWTPAYSKAGLQRRLGKRYMWLPSCGNATRKMPPTLNDEAACFKEIRRLMEVHGLVVLLCAEMDEKQCHRHYIVNKLQEAAV